MTEKDITIGNLLIAKFMDNWTDTGLEPAFHVHNHKGYELHELQFHTSWDWLIPVVEKIGSTDYSSVDIHWGTGCTDSFAWCDILWSNNSKSFHTSDDLNTDEQSLIKAIWLAVIEFIKWYNKNVKK